MDLRKILGLATCCIYLCTGQEILEWSGMECTIIPDHSRAGMTVCLSYVYGDFPNCVPLDSCGGLPDGRYPSCTSCSKFVDCDDNEYTVTQCPANTFYNIQLGGCSPTQTCSVDNLIPANTPNPNPQVTHLDITTAIPPSTTDNDNDNDNDSDTTDSLSTASAPVTTTTDSISTTTGTLISTTNTPTTTTTLTTTTTTPTTTTTTVTTLTPTTSTMSTTTTTTVSSSPTSTTTTTMIITSTITPSTTIMITTSPTTVTTSNPTTSPTTTLVTTIPTTAGPPPTLAPATVTRQGRLYLATITFVTGCITDCTGMTTGFYPSCRGCSHVLMCLPFMNRPVRCFYGHQWDDDVKVCQRSSSTCTEILTYDPEFGVFGDDR